jgi:hypothetical protein
MALHHSTAGTGGGRFSVWGEEVLLLMEFLAKITQAQHSRDTDSVTGENTAFAVINHPTRSRRQYVTLVLSLLARGMVRPAKELLVAETRDQQEESRGECAQHEPQSRDVVRRA